MAKYGPSLPLCPRATGAHHRHHMRSRALRGRAPAPSGGRSFMLACWFIHRLLFLTELFVEAGVCSPTVLRQTTALKDLGRRTFGAKAVFFFSPHITHGLISGRKKRGRRKGKIEFLAKMSGGNELLPPPPPSLSAKKQRHFFHAASFKAKGGKTGLYHSCMHGMNFLGEEKMFERGSVCPER